MLKYKNKDKDVDKNFTNKKHTYQQFNKLFLVVTLFPLTFVGLFNYFVDPYGITKISQLAGWNLLKPHQDDNVRLFKAIEIIEEKPKIAFLGSSTVILGLDPNHPVFSDTEQVPYPSQPNTYNLGLTGVYIDELSYYFQHLIANQDHVETIILGLDFFMFKKKKSGEISYKDLLGKTRIPWLNIVQSTFSLDTLNDSIDTVQVNLKEPNINPQEYYYIKGMRNNDGVARSFAQASAKSAFELQISKYFNNFYKDYELDPNAIDKLKNIVEICKAKNIKLKVFNAPIHASQLEAIHTAGLWPAFEEWKSEVSKIVSFWDFATYNYITTETINNDMQYFFDSAHYRKKVGDLVINRLYDYHTEKIPKDFGVLINEKNMQPHLKNMRIERENWAKTNINTIKFVQALKTQSIVEKN